MTEEETPPPPPRVLTWEEVQHVLSPAGDLAGKDGKSMAGTTDQPDICTLYRAIFALRQSAPSPAAAVALLMFALQSREGGVEDRADAQAPPPRFPSVLFRHEVCYLLGQIGAGSEDPEASRQAYAGLHKVLLDTGEDEVTRHEAAEGIAAVQSAASAEAGENNSDNAVISARAGDSEGAEMLRLLEQFSQEKSGKGPLAETCYLAVEGIRRKGVRKVCACQYASHDPALGDPGAGPQDIERYRILLASAAADLFERYVAMFTLRNLGACQELADVLDTDKSSVVLRHELAFVLGQMESDIAAASLARNLAAAEEHVMVRHEAAIALGSIGGEFAKARLNEFVADPEPMVAESCQVALDTAAYWEAWEALEARLAKA